MSLFCWTQRKIFWRMWETEQFWGTIDFHSIFFPTMEVNGAPKQPGYKLSSKYLPLCSAEQRNSYRFGTTWGRVNDDRIFIFGWTIPLRCENCWLSVLCMLQLCDRHPGSSKDHDSSCHHSFCAGSLPSCTAGGVYSQTRLSLEVTGVFICACLCNNVDM